MIEVRPPENRDLPDIKGHILEYDTIVLVNPHFVCVEMKIGTARVIGGEIPVLDHRVTVRKVYKFFSIHEVRVRRRSDRFGVNFLGIEIVSAVLGDIKFAFAVDAHMPFRGNLVPL